MNILGDAYGAAIIEATSKAELQKLVNVNDSVNEVAVNGGSQAMTKL